MTPNPFQPALFDLDREPYCESGRLDCKPATMMVVVNVGTEHHRTFLMCRECARSTTFSYASHGADVDVTAL